MNDRDEHPLDYLPELALGVLGDAEAEPLRVHVAGCAMCRAEFEEMSRVTRMLPLAAEDIEPNPLLKDALLERIAAESKVVAFPVAASVVRPRRWQMAGALAAGIALVLVIGGATGFALRGGDSGNGRDSARQVAIVEAAARGDLRVTRMDQGPEHIALLRAPGASDAFIWVDGLRQLPEGKAYQAWFAHDLGHMEPSTVFTTSSGGAWLPANGAVDSYGYVGLTIEDKGGAKEPSTQPFLLVDLSKSARAVDVPLPGSGSQLSLPADSSRKP